MRIWRITSPYNGWDIYLAAVVAAPDEETARLMHPDGESTWDGASKRWNTFIDTWPTPDELSVELIGVTYDDDQRVILSSYNAG